jgi:hypothetical protein
VGQIAHRFSEFLLRQESLKIKKDAPIIIQLAQLSLVAKRNVKGDDAYETSYLFRDEPKKQTDDLLRKVLLISCSLRAYGTVRKNPGYEENIRSANLGVLNATSKKSKKKNKKTKTKEEIQMANDFFTNRPGKSGDAFYLSLFRKYVNDMSESGMNLLSDDALSCHSSLTVNERARDFQHENSVVLKFETGRRANVGSFIKADVLRKALSWMGVVRVWSGNGAAVVEFESGTCKSSVFPGTADLDVGVGSKFIKALCCGRNMVCSVY